MEKDLLEALKSRRSIRSFEQRQVSKEHLSAILEAGIYAPTAKGLQSPLIVSVQDADTVSRLSAMNAAVMGVNDDPYYGAPTILLVFGDGSLPTCVEDGSSVLLQLALAAHALGLGACWINRERQMFETDEGKALMRQWGVPDTFKGVGALALGYPDGEPPISAPRKVGYIIHV